MKIDNESDVYTMLSLISRCNYDKIIKSTIIKKYFNMIYHTKYSDYKMIEYLTGITDLLFKKNEKYNLYYSYDNLIICGFFHNLYLINKNPIKLINRFIELEEIEKKCLLTYKNKTIYILDQSLTMLLYLSIMEFLLKNYE